MSRLGPPPRPEAEEAVKLYDALDRAEKAATKGPWESVTVLPAGSDETRSWSESPWRIINGPPQVMPDYLLSRRAFEKPEDGDLIVLSRNYLRKLLDLWINVMASHHHMRIEGRDPQREQDEANKCAVCMRLAALDIEVGQ